MSVEMVGITCIVIFFSMQKAEYINSKVCDIHLVFLRHKKQRILPEEESFGHEADRFVPECNLPSHLFSFWTKQSVEYLY